jgi:hypothetical protein
VMIRKGSPAAWASIVVIVREPAIHTPLEARHETTKTPRTPRAPRGDLFFFSLVLLVFLVSWWLFRHTRYDRLRWFRSETL